MPPPPTTPSRFAARAAITLLVSLILCSLTSAALSPGAPEIRGRDTPTAEAAGSAQNATSTDLATSPTTGETGASPEATGALPEVPSATPTPETSPTESPEAPQAPRDLVLPRLSGAFESDEVLVTLRRDADAESITDCLSAAGATVQSEIPDLAVLVLEVEAGEVPYAIAVLSTCPQVRSAEPNYMAQLADTIPTDGFFGQQYGLLRIRAPQGWDLETGSSSVIIAVLDTGVDMGHPDLGAKIVAGHDFVNSDSDPSDDNGHGTHVAGIAAAVTNNGSGVAGVSWGALVMPIKVLNSGGNGTFANVAAGLVWATDNGAQVINMSLGGTSNSAVLQSAVDYAHGHGVVLVAASGNTGAASVLYPARYPNVIAVGATDSNDVRAGLSNYGPELDVMAPGVNIYSTRPGGVYGNLSGTSMAAGYVAGLAAVLRGIPGIGSPDVIAWEIESTALDLGAAGLDNLHGYGLIQMDGAINLALPKEVEPEPNPSSSVSGVGPGQIIPSATLAAAYTATVTPMPTATGAIITAVPTTSGTAEVWALGTEAPTEETRTLALPDLGREWPIGCSGIALVVGGAILALVLRKRTGRRHRQYFRLPQ